MSLRMRVGVNLPNYSDLGTRDAIRAIAERAEALGYESVWTTDHVLMPKIHPEPYGHILETLSTLAYLAAITDRVQLGTSIVVLPQRQPVLVAKQAATIDHLSGGRLVFGVGVGWVEEEFGFLGADFAARGRRTDEYIRALRELWTSPDPRFEGETVQFSEVLFSPRPQRPGGIPIVIGGGSPRALRRVAELADGWHAIGATPEEIRAGVSRLAELAPERDLEVSLRIGVALGRPRLPPANERAASRAVLEGEPGEIAARLSEYADAGLDHLVIEPETKDLGQFLADLERFAAEVTSHERPARAGRSGPG
jgi:probable F420-dependent oxidoreductase